MKVATLLILIFNSLLESLAVNVLESWTVNVLESWTVNEDTSRDCSTGFNSLLLLLGFVVPLRRKQ